MSNGRLDLPRPNPIEEHEVAAYLERIAKGMRETPEQLPFVVQSYARQARDVAGFGLLSLVKYTPGVDTPLTTATPALLIQEDDPHTDSIPLLLLCYDGRDMNCGLRSEWASSGEVKRYLLERRSTLGGRRRLRV